MFVCVQAFSARTAVAPAYRCTQKDEEFKAHTGHWADVKDNLEIPTACPAFETAHVSLNSASDFYSAASTAPHTQSRPTNTAQTSCATSAVLRPSTSGGPPLYFERGQVSRAAGAAAAKGPGVDFCAEQPRPATCGPRPATRSFSVLALRDLLETPGTRGKLHIW